MNIGTSEHRHTGTDVIIIGGGIAGLAAAWECRRAGRDVTLLESADRVGGLIRTERTDGLVTEWGPNAFLGDAEALLDLTRAVGLDGALVEAGVHAATRFIYSRGRLHPVPRGPGSLLVSRLLTWRGKGRLLAEWFVPPKRNGTEETVAAFVRRRLGPEALSRFVDPLVAGIFAGDPERLSLASAFPRMAELEAQYGGLLRGAVRSGRGIPQRTVRSFRDGMGMLPAALAAKLGDTIRLQTTATALRRGPDGRFSIACRRADGTETVLTARQVFCATPASAAAALLAALVPAAVAPLRDIMYAPVAVAHVAFSRRDIRHPLDGFGFLVPRDADVRLLGCLWSTSNFPGRAPADRVLFTCFYGGMRDPAILAEDDAALRCRLAQEMPATMGIAAEPTYCRVVRHAAAIPQYTIGHADRIARITAATGKCPGLHLTGNYFTGTSVSDTIAHAVTTVRKCRSA